MIIHEVNRFGIEHNYTTVDKIPDGYRVWNVGGIEGNPQYMPLCITYSGTHTVQPDRLLAIKVPVPDREIMERCSMRTGCGNLAETTNALKRKYVKQSDMKLLELAAPLFEKYTK